ncbi:MAG: hypothetical protein BMS9Abin10_0455 [Gammaproteobacteria bacterium]|nr:MAG: hypothetical protein BMS9Abin10_0455 [Gammaproteobacteria bacterium]
MATSDRSASDQVLLSRAVEVSIHIGLLVILALWSFQIVRPFIIPVLWGIIIAVAVYPAYRWLQSALGERRKLAAALFALLGLTLVIVPSLMLGGTLNEKGVQ